MELKYIANTENEQKIFENFEDLKKWAKVSDELINLVIDGGNSFENEGKLWYIDILA